METVPDKPFLTCGSENNSPVTSCFTTAAFPGMFLASTGTSRSIAWGREREDRWGVVIKSFSGAMSPGGESNIYARRTSGTSPDRNIPLSKYILHCNYLLLPVLESSVPQTLT